MERNEILGSPEFKNLCKELLVEEGYDGCDIRSNVEMHGLKFKKPASIKEINQRINLFVKRKYLKKFQE